ncbi:Miniconductance mechanosensitive channel MscM [Candidatus Profftia lariciata]|uniref:miniconductance mechanosensitive channel MscM n=1 Tax=Candidatus Profftia lariciata TaxID=1987921 RepID=UPI001D006B5E|nr:miniconductance mechanosensitive channel MscM [Candidatus Profftia lariciata]UDG81606.1 Miniconductance mechanosensitive channel MscM [Candidatus Profftia lariciata]
MCLITKLLITGLLIFSILFNVYGTPNEQQLIQELKQIQSNKNIPNKYEIIEVLESTLNWLNQSQESAQRIQQYQKIIKDFPTLTRELRQQLHHEDISPPLTSIIPVSAYEQHILQISSQLLEISRQLQQELDHSREISDSLSQIPQKQATFRKNLTEAEHRLSNVLVTSTLLSQAQYNQLQAEVIARKSLVDELEIEQLSADNRQELVRLQIDILRKRHQWLELQLKNLRNILNSQRQHETEQALVRTKKLVEQIGDLPLSIIEQLQINQELSQTLNQQSVRMDSIANQQRLTETKTLQVCRVLNTIREQAQWLDGTAVLRETMRSQVARLPDIPNPQQLDGDMAKLRVQRLYFENLLNKIETISNYKQNDGSSLTITQQNVLQPHLNTQRKLLNALLSGCDAQILELTKLKIANTQLIDAFIELKDVTHRYLFWTADVDPISLATPLDVIESLHRLLSFDTLSQLSKAFLMMLTSKETLLLLSGALILVGCSIYSRSYYQAFMERASSKVGKVTQDHISLTLRTVFWSILVALPLLILWAALGYGLRNTWPYSISVAIGYGVTAALPVLWAFMISAAFAQSNGLFIAHFRWAEYKVKRAMSYYRMSIWLIVPLLMALVTFDNMDNRFFNGSLGRFCFIMLCVALSLLTASLKRAGISLYLNKHGDGENLTNHVLWWILLCAPLIAAFSSLFGYLNTAKVLLARLESSVAIWFILLVVYYIIRRWMLIQRRRIAFERAKQRRAERLEKRNKSEDDSILYNIEGSQDIEEPVVDLDTISAQSLRLVRSILTMVALVSLIWLWSELHSAFAFLENIRLWDVTSSAKGVVTLQPITLGAVLIAILVMIVTVQLVKNMPALLELGLLQHLDLTPGTGYAITSITKYLLLLFGGLISFSMLGIEWAKLQWLIAALTLGLGFGLQEIVANFVSGLIILFEKPIRIGDTVTIRDLTGSVTKINTRATTISDWDRKEIIVPNKAFITEQFINWSLSDAVTRVVLTIPADTQANSQEVTNILLEAASQCSLVLETPAPEAYLVNIQQGIQIFELRIYAAEMAHRMPLRHQIHQLILYGFQQHNLRLPFPPLQMNINYLWKSKN